MTPKKLPRPRIQRAFVQWFRNHRHRFKCAVCITRITHQSIKISFPDGPTSLSANLSRWDLSILVTHQEVIWDMLLSLDALSKFEGHKRYGCQLCTEATQHWPSREALWIDHLFEPFLKWVNEQLRPPLEIQLYGTLNSVTWAELQPRQALSPH